MKLAIFQSIAVFIPLAIIFDAGCLYTFPFVGTTGSFFVKSGPSFPEGRQFHVTENTCSKVAQR